MFTFTFTFTVNYMDPTASSSLGTRWFRRRPGRHVKTEGNRQQGSQEDRDQMVRGIHEAAEDRSRWWIRVAGFFDAG